MIDLAYIIESAIVEHDESDGDMGPLALSLAIAEAVKRSIDYEAAVTALIELGPTWYSDRGVAIGIVEAALGIEGGDDER